MDKKVLIADDEQNIVISLEFLMKREGYQVEVANDGEVTAGTFRDACAKHDVLVGRVFPPLTTHTRISIGTMDEMQRAVQVFKQILG